MTTLTAIELRRFTAKIRVDPGGCWLWTAGRYSNGYGSFFAGGRSWLVHRLMYLLVNGHLTPGLQIDHTCHGDDEFCPGGTRCIHRLCVNPAHLEEVTSEENRRRALAMFYIRRRRAWAWAA